MRLLLLITLAAASCAAPPEAERTRYRGWFVEAPGAPLPSPLQLRRPHERLDAQVDWTVVPEAELPARLAAAIDAGRAPDLIGCNRGTALTLVRAQSAVRSVASVSSAVRRGIPWTTWVGRGEHAGELRDDLLAEPTCPEPPPRHRLTDPAVTVRAAAAARAFARDDAAALSAMLHPEALAIRRFTGRPARVRHVKPCAARGDAHLAFVPVLVTLEDRRSMGTVGVLTVWHRSPADGEWRLLVASWDPTAVQASLDLEPPILRHLGPARRGLVAGAQATLRMPPDGERPKPPPGQRFGWFVFDAGDVPASAHLVEFRNDSGVRLLWPGHSDERLAGVPLVSAGSLWHVGGEWQWRVWTPQPDGGMTFSEVRRFVH